MSGLPDISPGADAVTLSPRPDAVGAMQTPEPSAASPSVVSSGSARRPLRLSHRLSLDASSPLIKALPLPPDVSDALDASAPLGIDTASIASGSDSARSVDSLRSMGSLRSDSVAALSQGVKCAHTFDMSRVISAISIPEFRFEDDRWIFVRECVLIYWCSTYCAHGTMCAIGVMHSHAWITHSKHLSIVGVRQIIEVYFPSDQRLYQVKHRYGDFKTLHEHVR
jgi:hypothetical protein